MVLERRPSTYRRGKATFPVGVPVRVSSPPLAQQHLARLRLRPDYHREAHFGARR